MKKFLNYPLENIHTFKVKGIIPQYIELESNNEIDIFFKSKFSNYYILGGGSNVLFLNIPEIIIKLSTKGIKVIDENNDYVFVSAKAGEIWDDFVNYCVNRNWGGLENLSLIPGTVGASPIQNIGAHGVEIKDSFYKLTAVNLLNGQIKDFYKEECNFSYRDSYFKKNKNEKWLILEVVFKLTKNNHNYCLTYGDLKKEFANKEVSLKAIRETIIKRRQAKLPDPAILGNAGSFFKNPFITFQQLENIKNTFPDVPFFQEGQLYKIPAAWLIEKAGLKGLRKGNTGTYHLQPLVIVNYGEATAKEILYFSEYIVESVFNKFNIKLEREVNVI